jgi:hypothetical protein
LSVYLGLKSAAGRHTHPKLSEEQIVRWKYHRTRKTNIVISSDNREIEQAILHSQMVLLWCEVTVNGATMPAVFWIIC